MRILKEPLFHFFLLGAAIFAWYSWLNPSEGAGADPDQIVVDAQDIERLEQQFEATWRRKPQAAEVEALVDSLVREEVLVREAKALGFDQGDSVIRNRLSQKMRFLTTSVAQSMEPADDILDKHLQAYPERFTNPPLIAFEQVSLGSDADAASVDAALNALNTGGDPTSVGTQSLLPFALPLSPQTAVDGTFGRGFFDGVVSGPDQTWQGPVQSGYGAHLVRLTERQDATTPPFDQVREAVLLDWRHDMTEELTEAQYQGLQAQYEIIVPATTGDAEKASE